MNEKFWDMKKEKQDRIMNAAIGVFATQGYAHASTDEIVKRAGISKGLLFHYFISKQGLYDFLYDYFSRFMRLELSGIAARGREGFFERCIAIETARTQAMKQYPFIQCFLTAADEEDADLIGGSFGELRGQYHEFCETLYIGKECYSDRFAQHYEMWRNVVRDVSQGAVRRNTLNGELNTKEYIREVCEICALLADRVAESTEFADDAGDEERAEYGELSDQKTSVSAGNFGENNRRDFSESETEEI